MRIEMKNSVQRWLLTGTCVVFVWKSADAVMPEQSILKNALRQNTTSRSVSQSDPVKLNRPVVLARNVNSKNVSAATTATPVKSLTAEDKKAVSRCWKRLMSMVREVNHTQRTKK